MLHLEMLERADRKPKCNVGISSHLTTSCQLKSPLVLWGLESAERPAPMSDMRLRITISRPFLTRFATRLEDRAGKQPDLQSASNVDTHESCKAPAESRFTEVRNETTDDE